MDNSGTIRDLLLYRTRLFGGVFVAGVIPGALLLAAGVTPPLVFALVLFGVALVPWTIGPAIWSLKSEKTLRAKALARIGQGLRLARPRKDEGPERAKEKDSSAGDVIYEEIVKNYTLRHLASLDKTGGMLPDDLLSEAEFESLLSDLSSDLLDEAERKGVPPTLDD